MSDAPIPVRLPCPSCGELHVDEGEFATRPHHTHACQSCGMVWRPAVAATVGVRFLPGFLNEPEERAAQGAAPTAGLAVVPDSSTDVVAESAVAEAPAPARSGGRMGRKPGAAFTAVLDFMRAQGGVWTAAGIRFHPQFHEGFSATQVDSAVYILKRAGLIVRAGKPGQYRVVEEDQAEADVAEPATPADGESDPITRTPVDLDAARRRAAEAMSSGDVRSGDYSTRGPRG